MCAFHSVFSLRDASSTFHWGLNAASILLSVCMRSEEAGCSVESAWPPWEWRVGANTGSGMVLSYWKWLHHNPNNRAVHPDVATLQLLVSQLCADSLCSTLNELEVRECNLWVVCCFTARSLGFFLPAEFLHSNIFPLHLGFLNLKSACICFFQETITNLSFHILLSL